MDKIQKVVKTLSSKVDIHNSRTITFIAAAIIIIFAIVYVYQSRKTLEGFASYSVTGANDTVLLGDLNKVKVGTTNTNLIDAITKDSTFDSEVGRKITEITGSFITPEDLTNNLSSYPNRKDVNNLINTSLGNYIKNSDITTSSELNTLIDRKINANNVQTQEYVNAQVQQTIPNIINSISNIPKLIGIINYAAIGLTILYGFNNKVSNSFILGKDSNNNNINLTFDRFDAYKQFLTGQTYIPASLICYFDWKNDRNIFYDKGISSYTYNYAYFANYPSPKISPFITNNIKTNTQYLFDVSLGFLMANNGNPFKGIFNTLIGVYCILFNGAVENPIYDVKLVATLNEYNEYNKNISRKFVVNTTDNTFNIGLYCVGFSVSGKSYGQITIDPWLTSSSSISIYEIQNASQILATQSITNPITTRPRTT